MNSTSILREQMFNEDILSKTIQFVRFPLIVGVVMIHSGLENCINTADYPIFSTIQFLISRVIARVAVPLFFFISGFLFFYKVDTFTLHTYFSKLKKRFRSLLIPYIFWNLIILLGLWSLQTLFPSLFNREQLIREYGICDWLRCFWNGPVENVPINTALWFVRDLMVMCCLSPIIWILVKKRGGGNCLYFRYFMAFKLLVYASRTKYCSHLLFYDRCVVQHI